MRNRVITIVMLLFCMLALIACGTGGTSPNIQNQTPEPTQTQAQMQTNDNAESSYRRISAEDAYQMMQDADEYILLDVRTEEEYRTQRIEGAVLLSFDEIRDRVETKIPDKNMLILLYCRSGNRSQIAANELIELGYTNVYDFGGIETDWVYETISG